MARSFRTDADFKRALEARVRAIAARTDRPIHRVRQMVVYDRMLARLFLAAPERVVLKGGVALEVRTQRARTTVDLDVSVSGQRSRVVAEIEAAARMDLGDRFGFTLQINRAHPEIVGDGVLYGGVRYHATARLAGAIYGDRFGVDVAFGHAMAGAPDLMLAPPFLDFVDVAATPIRLTNRSTHLAEKLHAYTQPRAGENSRVKDLPDMAILALDEPLAVHDLRAAIEYTFRVRSSHAPPPFLPPPPPSWADRYARLARTDRLPWHGLAEVYAATASFLDPVLTGAAGSVWNPSAWEWQPG